MHVRLQYPGQEQPFVNIYHDYCERCFQLFPPDAGVTTCENCLKPEHGGKEMYMYVYTLSNLLVLSSPVLIHCTCRPFVNLLSFLFLLNSEFMVSSFHAVLTKLTSSLYSVYKNNLQFLSFSLSTLYMYY